MTLAIAQTHSGKTISLVAKMANRHGLIAGATGTGKTVTLRKLAEAFSDEGVPVFLADFTSGQFFRQNCRTYRTIPAR